MNLELIFWLTSVVSFWGYAVWYFISHGVPRSWSQTFYNLEKFYNKKGIGYVYTLALWISMFALLPVVMNTNPIMFLPIAMISFVGAAMDSKLSDMSEKVHVIGASGGIAATIILLWLSYGLWWVALPTALAVGLMMWKKTKPKNNTTWIETLVIFVAHVVTLFINVL